MTTPPFGVDLTPEQRAVVEGMQRMIRDYMTSADTAALARRVQDALIRDGRTHVA